MFIYKRENFIHISVHSLGNVEGEWLTRLNVWRSRDEVRESSILTYETVEEIDLEYTRPIIVLGPMKVRDIALLQIPLVLRIRDILVLIRTSD